METKKISARSAQSLLQQLAGTNSSLLFSGNIEGDSMLPWIKKGDTIKLAPIGKELEPGDIVAFYQESLSRIVAHRLIKISQSCVITKGDNCFFSDLPVLQNALCGKVEKIYRGRSRISFGLGKEKHLIVFLSRFNILTAAHRLFKKISRFSNFGIFVA